uniref:Vezatin n=1 Tax=Anopheles atroparvus TaxID=41427 RepID=A0AAG5DVB7_ANOAO
MGIFSYPKSVSKTSAILKILTSRRLLMEHLEMLEQFYIRNRVITRNSRWEYLLEVNLPFGVGLVGCLLPIAVTSSFSRSLVVTGCVATTSALVFCGLTCIKYNNGRLLGSITDLIAAIEQFDNTMRKIQKLIDETAAGETYKMRFLCKNFNEKMIAECIINGREVNVNLLRYYMTLELFMDDLQGAVIEPLDLKTLQNMLTPNLQDISKDKRTVKTLYHFFLFIQSACLAALGMSVGNDNTVLVKTSTDMCKLKRTFTKCTERLMRFVRVLDVADPRAAGAAPLYEKEPIPREFELIKNHSLDVAIKLLAVAKDMAALDDELQSANLAIDKFVLEEAVTILMVVQHNLLMRSDDCERLVINLKKMLNKIDAIDAAGDSEGQEEVGITMDSAPNVDNRVSADTVVDLEDEFYLHTGGEEVHPDGAETSTDGLQAAEQQVAKRQMERRFRPVLRQLRERLQPIQLSFREREKTAIKRMGMDLNALNESEGDDGTGTPAETESLCSDDDDKDEKPRQPLNTQNRYDEGRSLLASKQQIAFFFNPALKPPLEESILE